MKNSKLLNSARYSAFALLAFLTGCALSSSPRSDIGLDKMMEEATVALSSGQRDKSLALLDEAAKANPTSAKPWLKMAQTHFDAGNYPAAILAADEVTKREPSNQSAKSIAVVAGLRVAVRALGDMRSDSGLRGTTRTEAERLAKSMRETLGEDILVPADMKPVTKTSIGVHEPSKPSSRPRAIKRNRNTGASTPPSAPTLNDHKEGGAPNPFGSLR